jgi:hypothetical protein
MRILAMGLLALALCACVQREPRERAADGCAQSATHEVTWSSETQPDTITARSDGPTCAQAVVTFTVRNHAGDPLWAFASTYPKMTSGGLPPQGAPAVTKEEMDAFLANWADVTLARSGTLPEWTDGAASPSDSVGELAYSTPISREEYQALRQRNLPQICYAAGTTATQCLIVDPTSHAPTMIVAYGL